MIAALSSVAAVKTTYVENVPYTQESEEIFSDLASKNELVIVNGEYASFLSIVAKRFPHVKFLECGGHTYLPNEFPFYVSNWYPAYDLGVAAGLLTKSGKLGYIGAFPSAYQYDDLNGLLIGARTVNPKATVACVYISSYFDPTKATTAANALIDNGAEFLFSIEDEPSFLEVANRRGVWCAYWNTSVPQFAPHTYVNSYDLEWGPFFTEEARKVLEGTWIAEKQIHLLPVNLGAWGAHVPDSVKNRVASIRKKYPLGYNFYKGPMDNDHGKQVLARGQSLTPSQAYVIDWVVEGVKGSGV
jgi:simple sugar transport system substrate-binding protein